MKKYGSILFVLAIAVLILGLLGWVQVSDNHIKEHGVKVTATLVRTGGNSVTVNYTFENRNYTVVVGHSNYTLQNGESYNTLIDKEGPSECIVDFSSPVFENSNFEVSDILTISKLWGSNKIKFKYVFDNVQYVRIQSVSTGVNFENSKKMPKLFVNKLNPRISYVLF
jgi:hypothetical protein